MTTLQTPEWGKHIHEFLDDGTVRIDGVLHEFRVDALSESVILAPVGSPKPRHPDAPPPGTCYSFAHQYPAYPSITSPTHCYCGATRNEFYPRTLLQKVLGLPRRPR